MLSDTLAPDRLMAHVRALCKEIGARPATSDAERRAAGYVQAALASYGIADVRRFEFDSIDSAGWSYIPYMALGALALPAARLGRIGKLIGAIMLLAGAYNVREAMLAKPPVYHPFVNQGRSQTIIARIPPTGETRHMVFIVAHLDSNKQRFLLPFVAPHLTRALNTLGLLIAGMGGLSMLLDAVTAGKRGPRPIQTLAGLGVLGLLAGLLYDETQPYVEGANDNASAVAVALGLAAQFAVQPLQHTEVTLLFTGSEEAGCIGMEKYLDQYAPPLESSTFIDLEMVGTGDLCYVQRHGISLLSEYRPAPQITALSAQVARQNTDLRVTGKPMTIVEEAAPLVRRGYEAICIAGYDASGALPNWHRLTDTLENIQPDTLGRAARYVSALVSALDAKVGAGR
jgi:hypothetical protein